MLFRIWTKKKGDGQNLLRNKNFFSKGRLFFVQKNNFFWTTFDKASWRLKESALYILEK